MKSLFNLLSDTTLSLLRPRQHGVGAARAARPQPSVVLRQEPETVDIDAATEALIITCPDPTAEDAVRGRHIGAAQALVRQERWSEVSAMIGRADAAREMTPGAMPVADLMAYGARADVVMAVEHALLDGTPDEDAPVLEGIEALEHELADHEGDPIIAAIVAGAHMDIGWYWRGTGWQAELPERNRLAFEAHFDRAESILQSVEDAESPLVAAQRCALLAGTSASVDRVARSYERLIDLNPINPRPMRALGTHLLPRWFGDLDALELQARRTAARTIPQWGAGGYTWVMFDAVAHDDAACARLDVDFFIDGLHDILARRPDAYTVNLLAAFCANAVGQVFSGNDEADQVRACIADCAHWIVRDHLTELHPMIWAHAARGFDNNLTVGSPGRFAAAGRKDAMRLITRLFRQEIAAGQRIVFGKTGAEVIA